MKATELRIGNILQYEGRIGKVWSIYVDAINLTHDDSPVGWYTIDFEFESAKELKPVMITHDWLINFGFEQEKDWNYKDQKMDLCPKYFIDAEGGNGRITYYLEHKFMRIISADFETGYKPIEMEYVHQLQNLYFALTGEELTIKP
jgi:hypothetical protein